ncbi:MAG TPA: pitrilysin family protein [Ferruginibacter sp.]|nr:pitrilysin family protein [Ferruginibacter sp.]HMP20683.1 pitrilysin family protein [Ferruginibacter sp.]
MLNRTAAPPVKDAIDFNLRLKPYDHFILNNGVEVYAIDAGSQDVLQLELVFFAGNSAEDANAVAAATNHLLKNGTSSKTAFQINEHFEYYGAYCNRTCHNETATISLHTLSKYLPQLLPVVREMITDSIFPEQELAVYTQNSKQKLSVSLKKCDFVANRLIDAYLYGNHHPYGKYISASDYDTLQTVQLKSHFKQHYLNGRCIIFVAGKLPPDIFMQLNNLFGDLTLNNHRGIKYTHAVEPAVVLKHRISNDPNGVQGAIRIARHFPGRHHPDYVKNMMLNTVFGGFFGSRLMSNIREDKGYTYGIHSYVQNHLQDTAWVISTEAGKEVCEAAIQEVYKEMQILREEKIDEEELLLVRNYMIGSILGDLDGPFHLIGRWKNIILNNLTEEYFYHSIDTIKNIPAEALQELAQKYLQPESFYELVVV